MLFQAFTSIFTSSKPETASQTTTPQANEGEKLAPINLGPVTEGLQAVARKTPDAQLIFDERETRRDIKDRFYTVEGGISTKTLARLVERLRESKGREEEARNRIRAKVATKTQAKETKRQQLRARMEAKKQPHLDAIARIEDQIIRARLKK